RGDRARSCAPTRLGERDRRRAPSHRRYQSVVQPLAMQLPAADLALGAIWFLAFLFSTTVHEACHALVAWKLGDPTAYHGGPVTLNPWPAIQSEPVGTGLQPRPA